VLVVAVMEVEVLVGVTSLPNKQAEVQVRLKCLDKRPVVKSSFIGVG
jgi:hypothetical protein